MNRYEPIFARDGIAFIPFLMVGDPSPSAFIELVDIVVEAGAEALELGIPFSDPIADGPTVQAAAQRAISAGTTPELAFEQIAEVRRRHPDVPIGLLVYANLVVGGNFYERAARAGVDSVLVADVPTLEGRAFAEAARVHDIEPVFIATAESSDEVLRQIAELGSGYTYVVTRRGVTGAREELELSLSSLVERLEAVAAPPPVFGFGISKPEHVRAAAAQNAAGAISGSAVIDRLEDPRELQRFVEAMARSARPNLG